MKRRHKALEIHQENYPNSLAQLLETNQQRQPPDRERTSDYPQRKYVPAISTYLFDNLPTPPSDRNRHRADGVYLSGTTPQSSASTSKLKLVGLT